MRLRAAFLVAAVVLAAGCTADLEDNGAKPSPTATPTPSPVPGPPGGGSQLGGSFVRLYDAAIPSVVSVEVYSGGGAQVLQSRGTGFVYDESGHIVTNQHVVEGGDSFEVTFHDGETLSAELVGTSVYNDLAVLQVEPDKHELRPLPLGDSSQLQEGAIVVALGNPLGFEGSMTHGIVSGLNRLMSVQGGFSIPGVVQTDAPINPGNSGGPLMNLEGEVVGVNRAKAQAENLGFAIPSDIVNKVVPVLIERGEYPYPWIGIRTQDVNPAIAEAMGLEEARGVEVVEVVQDSPADRAGLRGATDSVQVHGTTYGVGGDVIVGIDGRHVRTIDDLLSYLALRTSVGDEVTLTVIRDGSERRVEMRLGERPEP